MFRINWVRFLIGGVIASIIFFVTDGVFHEHVVAADWQAVYNNLGIAEPHHSGTAVAYFAVFELGRGFISMFLYVLMRSFWRKGPQTAALAGIVSWIAFSLTGPAQFIPLGFFSNPLWFKVAAFQFVMSIVAAVAGAALYKDAVDKK